MNKVVTIKEMIETIKEKMNWSEAILAIELGVDSQNLLAWKRGRTPRSKNYKRLKEIYESLSEDDIKDELSLKFKQTENNILKYKEVLTTKKAKTKKQKKEREEKEKEVTILKNELELKNIKYKN